MMHTFISNNRAELIERCKTKVAQRTHRSATDAQLRNGIPIFLEQLQRTLMAEEGFDGRQSLEISGPAGGAASNLSEIGVSATAHGRQLLELGFTVDQVVHDYGDLCQAITDLAVERDAPFGVDEFRTLNRCLDNAIADAVTEFSYQKEMAVERQREFALERRIGSLAHEMRNALSSATLAMAALETGGLPIHGATGAVLKRSLASMTRLISSAVEEVRERTSNHASREVFAVAGLIADAAWAAELYASTSGCTLTVGTVDPEVFVNADRERILAALANLLQNAFKFTAPGTEVSLAASAYGSSVSIEVSDHCGGLAHGSIERMFSPFTQRNTDRSGLGLGLSIARQSVEADGGTLTVKDRPGHGCTFVMTLPRHRAIHLPPGDL
ncbi:sensor histidine kinase [Ramlibacter sp. PS4R-6]|uniref:sensor histidine kinase n=1 Tax=Ramlibacter sp. PS4R-6 TaxID=3133438 RepID=UPI0030AC9311